MSTYSDEPHEIEAKAAIKCLARDLTLASVSRLVPCRESCFMTVLGTVSLLASDAEHEQFGQKKTMSTRAMGPLRPGCGGVWPASASFG